MSSLDDVDDPLKIGCRIPLIAWKGSASSRQRGLETAGSRAAEHFRPIRRNVDILAQQPLANAGRGQQGIAQRPVHLGGIDVNLVRAPETFVQEAEIRVTPRADT